jgi:hypothetical protein
MRITRQRRALLQVGGPAFIAGSDHSICVLGTERGVISAHRPGVLKVIPLDLEYAIALITAGAVKSAGRTIALVGGPVTALILMPV